MLHITELTFDLAALEKKNHHCRDLILDRVKDAYPPTSLNKFCVKIVLCGKSILSLSCCPLPPVYNGTKHLRWIIYRGAYGKMCFCFYYLAYSELLCVTWPYQIFNPDSIFLGKSMTVPLISAFHRSYL